MRRRQFLQSVTALSTLTMAGRLFAAPVSTPRFLLVFLRGGYDCANVLIPYSSADYYAARPTIAIPKPSDAAANDAVVLNADWALTPALSDSIAPLYMKGEATFIPFAGTDDMSRSHFETQDSIELGQPSQGTRDFRSGFMARLATQLQGTNSIAFTDSLPLIFRGANDIPNISLKSNSKPVFDQHQASVLTAMYTGHHLQPAVSDGLGLQQEIGRAMEQEKQEANRNAVTPKGFDLEAQRVARLMREQYRLGFIDIGGWDTHVNQGAVEGTLATNLKSLGSGLTMLARELGSEWQNTVVVVLSEFGRTFHENGNRGTDHGHGTAYWVLGGAVRGKRVTGEQVKVSFNTLLQNRDLPVLNDYRAVLGGLFRQLWGLSYEQIQNVFPQSVPIDLQLV